MTANLRHLSSFRILSRILARSFSAVLVLLMTFPLLLAGCGRGDFFDGPREITLSGAVHGGQQPVAGALIQIYAVGTTGDGSASTPLLTTRITTSDGTNNPNNSNANAGNGFNAYPVGAFSLPAAIPCPSSSSRIYITGTGGNPGLGANVVNPNLALMAVLGQCSQFTANSYVSVNELTTVGSVAPLSAFMNGYTTVGSASSDAAVFTAALDEVGEYTNVTTGAVPGPSLPANFYASSSEIATLSDIVATCINSPGGVAGDGSACGVLFSLVAPAGVTPPTDTIGAMLDVIKYPTNNVCPIYNLTPANGPYQGVLTSCPLNWELPIEPIVTTPTLSPIAGNYVGTQTVQINDATAGTTIYYTTDGTIPTISSPVYTSAIALSASATVKAFAAASGYKSSAIGQASFVITPAATPTQLAFVQQPTNTATGYTIAPPISVAVEDATGNIVTNATNPVTIALTANPPAGSSTPATLSGTLTMMPSNGIATFLTPSIDVIANGYQFTATSGGLSAATSSAFNITAYPITISPASNLVGVGSTLPGTFTLSQPAPAAGVTVTLASSSGAVSIVPASVTLTSGQTVGSFTYTGISTGSATLSASATNYLTGNSTVAATNSLISLGQLPVVAPGQTSSLALSLGVVAPAGGVTVSLSSSNTAAATVTPSVFIPAGFRIGGANPQITGVAMGTTTITASAPGYSPDIRTVNVSLSASFPASTTIPLTSANPVVLTISAPAPSGGLTFTLSSDNPAIASVPASITVPQGSTTVNVPVTGVAFGMTTIRADSPGVVEATTSVKVQASIAMAPVTTGTNEFVPANVTLGATATPPTTVTITSLNPSVALLSTSPTVAGATSISLSNVTNQVPTFYVQGQNTVGTASLQISAPGYITATGTAVVDPVGVVIYSGLDLTTTATSAASTITLATAILDPNSLTILGYNGTPNPGAPAYSIAVTSSTPAVGTITTSPVMFASGGSGVASTGFNPLTAGSSTISLGAQPSGFFATSTTGTTLSGVATVTTNTGIPNIGVSVPATGIGLEVPAYFALGAAPAGPVNVTLTSSTGALLSSTSTGAGAASITFPNVASASPVTFYVQGQTVGAPTLTVSAAGYNTSTSTITVDQSGIVFAYGSSTSTFSTTSSSTPTTLTLLTAILDPRTLAVACLGAPPQCGYALNPGTSLQIAVNNGTPVTGTLTGELASSYVGTVTMGANGSGTTAFTPANVGTTALSLGDQPSGFTATSSGNGYLSGTATVTGPAINVSNVTTGANLYVTGQASFATAPTQPVTVTLSSSNPGVATISASPTTVGTQSVTFTNVNAAIPTFYVQGTSVGTATLSVLASGYTTGTSTITVDPSGIVFFEGNQSSTFATTNFSSPTTITLATAILDPTTLQVLCGICYYPINPGVGAVSIPVTSSAPNVGTITNNPVTFPAGTNGAVTTAFNPLTAGMATIALGTQPAGFTATGSSGGYLSGTATVTSPPVSVNVNSVTTGVGLYVAGQASLSAAAPSPVSVTITSSNPNVALLSTNASAVGQASITFTNVTTTIPAFYIQGQTQGTSGLTATVAGYANGNATITVDPSGIVFYQGNQTSTFSTTSYSNATTLTLATAVLDPSTLQVLCGICYYPLNPQTGPFSVAVISSATSVGTIVTTPVTFQPGSNGLASTGFQPVSVGQSTVALGTQPVGFTAATSGGFVSGTATVTGPTINSNSPTTGVDVYVQTNASLAVAPPSAVPVTITVSPTSVATITANASSVGTNSITFPGVSGTSYLNYFVQGQNVGTATLTVSAPGYATATTTITVDPTGIVFYQGQQSSTFTTTDLSSPTTLTLVTSVLDPKALTVLCGICTYPINPGAGPFSIPVTSGTTSVGTISSSPVTMGANGVATTTFQPVAPGSSVISLGTQPAPFTATASTPGWVNGVATVTGPCVNIGAILTGAGFYATGNASLQVSSSPITVTLTSSNPNIALLSGNSTVTGTTSISFSNVTGQVPAFYVQGQAAGTATISASAPGFCTGTATVTVDPPSIVFYTASNITGSTFSTTTFSSPTTVHVSTAILDPTSLALVATALPLNPGYGPLTIPLTSSSTTIGTISGTATFPQGSNGIATAQFTPVNVGNTTLSLGTEPSGFATTSSTTNNYLNGTATVSGPTISLSAPTAGAGTYTSASASLAQAPPSPVTVTITSSNPATALLSSSVNAVGSASLTFNNITGALPTFYVQGLTVGTATMTAVATGYTTANATITVDPVGIVFQNGLTINTTTFSPATIFTVTDALLDPVTYAVIAQGVPFNPNYGPFTINLSSTNTVVGTVTSSISFAQGGNGQAAATFAPVGPGTTTISLGTQPAGFTSTLSTGTYLNGPATVSGPNINTPSPITGNGLYVPASASFAVAPPSGETVTITSASPGVALLSASPTSAGSASITFNNVTSIPTFYVQGQSVGTSVLSITAAGYTSGTGTMTVNPSGIIFFQGSNSSTLSTTTYSPPTSITIATAMLDPGSLAVASYSPIPNPGTTLSIPVTSGTTSVGTVTSPVTFGAGANTTTTTFTPVGAGSTSITLGAQPAGFTATTSTPGYLSGTVTVSSPNVTISPLLTGAGLTTYGTVSLGTAPPSPVTITLSSANPAIATLSATAGGGGGSSITFNNVSTTTPITFYVLGQSVGTATLNVTATGYNGQGTITVDPAGFGFTSAPTFTTTTGSGNTTLTLTTVVLNPGALTAVTTGLPLNINGGSVSVPVTSANSAVGTILTSPVVFSPGATTAQTSFQPVGAGTSTIALTEPSGFSTPSPTTTYVSGTATVTSSAINAPSNQTTGVNLTNNNLTLSLGGTPSNPVTITVTSSNPAVATVASGAIASAAGTASITFVNITSTAGQSFNVQGQSVGTATISISATGYMTATFTVTVDPAGFGFAGDPSFSTTPQSGNTTLTLYTLVLDPNSLAEVAYNLPVNPSAGPYSIAVTSSNTNVGTILTSPVVFNAGASTVQTAFQPLAGGSSTIAVGTQPAGFSTPSSGGNGHGTATVTAPNIAIPYGDQITGASLTNVGNAVYLPAAPSQPVTVTLTSTDPTIVTLNAGYNASAAGTASITLPNITSAYNYLYFNLQGQKAGSTTVTATAPGYNSTTFNVTVYPSGFGLGGNSATFSTYTNSANTPLTAYTFVLNPGSLTLYTYNLPVNPGAGPFNVPVTSSSSSVGTILTSPLVFSGGTSSLQTAFVPAGVGTTTISLTQPAGFIQTSQASTYLTGTATVTAPPLPTISIPYGDQITGASLTNPGSAFYLPQAPTQPVTVTLTSADPTIATINAGYNPTAAGTQSVTFPNITSAYNYLYFNIQGQATGTTTITASAPGYASTTINVNVYPSGFGFSGNSQTFSTYTNSSPTNLTVFTFVLNPGSLTLYTYNLPVNPGAGPFNVAISSSNSSVGAFSNSPLVFSGGTSQLQASFQPAGVGASNVALVQPAGFSADSQTSTYISGTVTVSTPPLPTIAIPYGDQTTGASLTVMGSAIYLPATPSSAVTVTATVADPTIATISTGYTASAVGTQTITFPNITSAYNYMYFNIQGQAVGSTTITFSAPGYANSTMNVTVHPSSFGFGGGSMTFTTTTFSNPTNLTLYTFVLTPGTLNLENYNLPVNPGAGPFNVQVSSSNTSVGTITTSPVVFGPGTSSATTGFQPAAAGMSTIALSELAGFAVPSQTSSYVQGTATVTAPGIGLPYGDQTTGAGLTDPGIYFYLGTAPPNPVTVTMTSSNPSVATLGVGQNATTVGTTSIAFTNVGDNGAHYFNIQGQSAGTATITVSAPGYANSTFNVTVDPSGFGFQSQPTFTTTTYSSPTNLSLTTLVLNPGSFTYVNQGLPLNPGLGSLSIPVTSSSTGVGTITTSPVVFNAGSGYVTTSFQPAGAGSSTLAIGAQPGGFTTPSQTQFVQGFATVQQPGIGLPYGNRTTGANLTDSNLYVYLGQAPPSAVTMTLTSSDPTIATLGSGGVATAVGTASISFTGITDAGARYFNIQGQGVGTATISVSAPGYATAYFSVTVLPSAFGFASPPSVNTTTTASPTALNLFTLVLTSGTLTQQNYNLPLNPGIGPFTIAVTSSNTGVGTISQSPVTFSSGTSQATTYFTPVASGGSTIAIGAQPSGFSTPSQSGNVQGTAIVTGP